MMPVQRIPLGLAFALGLVGLAGPVTAKTMNDECAAQIAAAHAMIDAGDYGAGLAAFDALVDECGTKDGKEAVQAGRARALNGQKKYTEAIAVADAILEDIDDESLFALFEKAYAEEKLGDMEAATADYDRIIALTEKNENVAERASIYAKVADLHYKAGKTAEAETYLAKAVELDPGNVEYLLIRGDWGVYAGDYDQAFQAYDQAVAMGKTDAEMYEIRTKARLKMVEDKYGTSEARQLRDKMTPAETEQLCAELARALDLGLEDMKLDMFRALVCQ
jgi:tetratricopeptide (TPR) repeat protein